jgi:glyoxylase-like metal-dependent hydrolase (beta-lactamase superfamily II)
MTLKVFIVPVTPFEQNCSILICEKTNQAAIVDPGGDLPKILDALKEAGAIPEKILLTHGHIGITSQRQMQFCDFCLPITASSTK